MANVQRDELSALRISQLPRTIWIVLVPILCSIPGCVLLNPSFNRAAKLPVDPHVFAQGAWTGEWSSVIVHRRGPVRIVFLPESVKPGKRPRWDLSIELQGFSAIYSLTYQWIEFAPANASTQWFQLQYFPFTGETDDLQLWLQADAKTLTVEYSYCNGADFGNMVLTRAQSH